MQKYMPHTKWSRADDDTFMEAIANGAFLHDAGALVGKTKEQSKSRFRVLQKYLGWQAS